MEAVRPKQKKKKKTKTRSTSCDELEEISDEISAIDIDFPSTSTSEGNPQDCVTPKPVQREVEPEDASTEQTSVETKVQEPILEQTFNHTPAIQEVTPTAPVFQEPAKLSTLTEQLPTVHYPNLSNIRSMDAKIDLPKTEKLLLRPLSREQLNNLYKNDRIQLAKVFETEFVKTELSESYRHNKHPLYELLAEYSIVRHNLKIIETDIQLMRHYSKEKQNELWRKMQDVVVASGTCCGDATVQVNHFFEKMVYQEHVMDDLFENLRKLMNHSCFLHSKYNFDAEILNLKIEEHIRRLLVCCQEFRDIDVASPVVLSPDMRVGIEVTELRTVISILFAFLRQPAPDREFTRHIKQWLEKSVALQLRLATWHDHLFLLYHVLRCPAGVPSWAALFVQIPKSIEREERGSRLSLFDNSLVSHTIVLLSVVLTPIAGRNQFLEKLNKELNNVVDPVKEDIWILVDSDGEEGNDTETGQCVGLKENDLVNLIDQIPLEQLFRILVQAELKAGNYSIDRDTITGHHLLVALAFGTNFVELLGQGLLTYNTERYKQFAKRLGRLVKHIVFYLTELKEIWQHNLEGVAYVDPQTVGRINIEYDSFVMRATYFIYKSQKLGAWQYLTGFPFGELRIQTVWKLYYCLHVGYGADFVDNVDDDFQAKVQQNSSFDQTLNDQVDEIQAEDLYYLLQSFSAMVLARKKCDWDFIVHVTIDLLKIGFINEFTKDTCYKSVKDLLSNITAKHPETISIILVKMKENLRDINSLVTYLIKSLALDAWIPQWQDFEILANWLLNFSYETPESTTARIIFSNLNWNFDRDDQLFLPHDTHIRMANLIVDVAAKHVPEVIGTSGISESVRQVSNLMKNQSAKVQFTTWCWNMIAKLRLHAMDQSATIVRQTLERPHEVMRQISELESLASIYQGVTEDRPIAIHAAILGSLWGHSIPQICHKGFEKMKLLLTDYRHGAVIRCLQVMMPLFLECPRSLSENAQFQAILSTLLSSDKTYIKMAKELMTSESAGPILELLENMIQAQMIDYSKYGLSTPTALINLWLDCLTHNPGWYKDWSTIHLLDVIVRFSYQFPEAWASTKGFFKQFYKKPDEIKVTKKSTGIINLFSSSSGYDIRVSPMIEAPWLSICCLEVEHDCLEFRVWYELLRQLNQENGKLSLDAALKKACTTVICPTFPAATLCVFKWGQLVVNTPISHQLFPLVCQQFFSLYMARVPLSGTEERFFDSFGVADKFYANNVGLMCKIKKQLADAEIHYRELSVKEEDSFKAHIQDRCSKLMKSFNLWLVETNLNKMSSVRIDLPPQYAADKLASIFQGNKTHWSEFISLADIRMKQKESANSWLKQCFRYTYYQRSSLSHSSSVRSDNIDEDPCEKIYKRLRAYDAPKLPPAVQKLAPKMQENLFPVQQLNGKKMLQTDFQNLKGYANKFSLNVKAHKALDCVFKDICRFQYTNEHCFTTKRAQCTRNCDGVVIKVNFFKSVMNRMKNEEIENNRSVHATLIDEELMEPNEKIVDSILKVQFFTDFLITQFVIAKQNDNQAESQRLSKVGTEFFYEMIHNNVGELTESWPVTDELMKQTAIKLGIFIQERTKSEGKQVLEIVLKRPELIAIISEIFNPTLCPAPYFYDMYKYLVDASKFKRDPQILFVLLNKFDVACWLRNFKPKLAEISQVIDCILDGLVVWTTPDDVVLQDLCRNHLIQAFEYKFPEHFGEILQKSLNRMSDQNVRILPAVFLDLLNSIYRRSGCQLLSFGMSVASLQEELRYFATNQKLFTFQEVVETAGLLGQHFQNDRLKHSLNGLFSRHGDLVEVITFWLGTFNHAACVSAMHLYPGALADDLVNLLWPNISVMFSPWLIPYFPSRMSNSLSNWIKQVSIDQILLPWSERFTGQANSVLVIFVHSIEFLFAMLPASSVVLGHILLWYDSNYAHKDIGSHVIDLVHKHLLTLPWQRFIPTPQHIDCICRMLSQFLPKCHSFVGQILLRITWTPWLQHNITGWDMALQNKMLQSVLMIFVQMAFEPIVHKNLRTIDILKEAQTYQWHMLDYQNIEPIFDWFVMSTEPTVVLRMASEHKNVDDAILDLLQIVACMNKDCEAHYHQNFSHKSATESHAQAKRILYVRSIVRLLRNCGSKHQSLLANSSGTKCYSTAIVNLMSDINAVLKVQPNVSVRETEANNLMIEIVCSMQSQSENVANLFVEALIMWQSTCDIGNLLLFSVLNAISHCKSVTHPILTLLEATLFNYFRHIETNSNQHKPTWDQVLTTLVSSPLSVNTEDLVKNDMLLALHVFAYNRLRITEDVNEKLSVLQTIQTYMAGYKPKENEGKLILILGFFIAATYKLMAASDQARLQLIALAKYLLETASQSESWGGGLLGAIGLKRETFSLRRRVLYRCLATLIFSLTSSADDLQAVIDETRQLLLQKKFNDIRLEGLTAINLIDAPEGRTPTRLLYDVIRMFFKDQFLTTFDVVWER